VVTLVAARRRSCTRPMESWPVDVSHDLDAVVARRLTCCTSCGCSASG
jgi:hypothetical protein